VSSLDDIHCKSLNSNRTDVLTDFTILVSELEIPPGVMAVLLDGMSQVEHRLAFGTDEKLQAASLVGVFVQARHMMKVA
jgi:replication factor C subunit 3/5